MQTVYKYYLSFHGPVDLPLPVGARIVRVGLDDTNAPCVWVLVNPNNVFSTLHRLNIYGTGRLISDSKEYIGTFFNMPFVWHVFADTSI